MSYRAIGEAEGITGERARQIFETEARIVRLQAAVRPS
jgi:hypothetical protein